MTFITIASVRRYVQAEFNTDDKIRSYFAVNGSAAYKKRQIEHIIQVQESIYHLKVKIFGNKRLGLSSFIQLKQTIMQMKVTHSLKIKAWCQRFDTFQTYLPMTLWLAGEKRGE